jgi:aldose 1-epimerase
MHGFARRRAWSVVREGEDGVDMRIDHAPDHDWPFACEAHQGVRLHANRLELLLRLLNRGSEPMPAGIGWHHHATIRWPGTGLRLDTAASASLGHAILLKPADACFVCFEPTSHTIDGFNLMSRGAAGTGTRVLASGEALEGRGDALFPRLFFERQ